MQPIVAISSGEPAGIGPDIIIQIAQKKRQELLLVFGDPDVFLERAQQLNLPLKIESFSQANNITTDAATLTFHPISCPSPVIAGHVSPSNAPYVLQCISQAVESCVNGNTSALVTAPVHKGVINQSGVFFSGHTEFIAELTNTEHVVMMLATEGLRVALATTHLPLKEVASAITQQNLLQTILILENALAKYFCRNKPYIAICGLNPHAGEDGHLGTEEKNIIEPAVKKAREAGVDISDPLPADTIFSPSLMKKADAFLSMYHDQGLPVLKFMGFGKSVNITLGLPIIRTSVDHGTALNLAGKGGASQTSLDYAIHTAIEMYKKASGN
ncbi:MAG: 4-hydroxythreonine-4-phosphate dehydrogenase PdxA [Pseudomonadales bacterium]|nr:4-hydroxythreonine-4-phosphate dehydrogenase PdxA [Pseudomonadales bacterium]